MFDGLSIMTLFFAEFVHTDNGVTCSETGFFDLSTEQECRDSVDYAKSFNSEARLSLSYSWSHIPKGCSMHDDGHMNFNTHSTGAKASSRTSICKKGNT